MWPFLREVLSNGEIQILPDATLAGSGAVVLGRACLLVVVVGQDPWVLLPIPTDVPSFNDLTQWLKKIFAKNSHIFGGYAAVRAV